MSDSVNLFKNRRDKTHFRRQFWLCSILALYDGDIFWSYLYANRRESLKTYNLPSCYFSLESPVVGFIIFFLESFNNLFLLSGNNKKWWHMLNQLQHLLPGLQAWGLVLSVGNIYYNSDYFVRWNKRCSVTQDRP